MKIVSNVLNIIFLFRFNISNTEAIFNVALEIDTTFQLKAYAVNAIGRSLPAVFGKIRLGNPEKQEGC